MVKITDQKVNQWLNTFIKRIKVKYDPNKIILFGSRARGDNLIESDVDLVIVSKKFKSMHWRERIISVIQEWDGLVMLEPLCYTLEEFKTKKNEIGILQQALKEGKEIK